MIYYKINLRLTTTDGWVRLIVRSQFIRYFKRITFYTD